MKLPKLATPKSCYFWGGISLATAIGLAVFGPIAQGVLWIAGIGAVGYGLAMQFAPDDLASLKTTIKSAAAGVKATAQKDQGSPGP